MTIRIGISGWVYDGWRGRFYPQGLRSSEMLAYAAGRFDTIEINATSYRLQRPASFARWREQTPEAFVFAVKGSRYVTHMLRLRGIETALANFFASGVLRLEEKLGPFLWQLSSRFGFSAELLDGFLSLLPKTGEAAAALAARHDHRLAGRASTHIEASRPLRHAIEFRHASFCCPAFVALLRRHGAALVFADSVEWPYFEDVTADFVYLRLHGDAVLYTSGYSAEALDRWARRIALWAEGRMPNDARLIAPDAPAPPGPRDVYAYFDNDAAGHAPFDAMALRQRLG
jgi:uncharacterized protein YecE (DUF72 family)